MFQVLRSSFNISKYNWINNQWSKQLLYWVQQLIKNFKRCSATTLFGWMIDSEVEIENQDTMKMILSFTSEEGGIVGISLCGLNWIDTRAVVGFLNQSWANLHNCQTFMKLPESQLPGEDMARVRIKRVGGGGGGVGGEERGEKGRN